MNDTQNRTTAPELTAEEVKPTIFAAPENYTEAALQMVMQQVRAKRIDANKPIPEPELLLGMGNAPILRRGSLCFVCGQAGSRKTTALTLMCADMMSPGKIANSPFTIPKPLKILYIDPEQHAGDTQRINLRVKDLIGDDSNIDTYPLIEFPTDLIPYIIEQLLKSGEYDVCVVDNIAQMGKGIIMDIDRAEELVRNLRRLAVTYNCGFFGVIHMNEGAKTSRPRGHGGAEAVREGDLVWQFVEDGGKTFSVAEALKSRLLKPQKWAIAIDGNGLPYYHEMGAEPTPKTTNPDNYAKYVALLSAMGMTPNAFGREIDKADGKQVKSNSKPSRNAYNLMSRMASDEVGVIVKRNGLYYPAESAPEEEEQLPF